MLKDWRFSDLWNTSKMFLNLLTWWAWLLLLSLAAAQTVSPSAYLTLHCDNRGILYLSHDQGATWEVSGTADHWPTPFVTEILDVRRETVLRWECMFWMESALYFSISNTQLFTYSDRSPNHISLFVEPLCIYKGTDDGGIGGFIATVECMHAPYRIIGKFYICSDGQITASCSALRIPSRIAIGHWFHPMTGSSVRWCIIPKHGVFGEESPPRGLYDALLFNL